MHGCAYTWYRDLPSLIEVDQKHKVISKHSNAVGGWHDNDEGKDIINEGVECLEKDIPVIHDQHFVCAGFEFYYTCRLRCNVDHELIVV